MSFIGQIDVSAEKFDEIFRKHDKDGNKFLVEADGELDHLITDILKEAGIEMNNEAWKKTLEELRACDENKDGKISAVELSKILVPHENFLFQFREKATLTAADLLKVWRKYDADKSGRIDLKESETLCKDIINRTSIYDPNLLDSLEKFLMETCMKYGAENETFSLSDIAKILPVETNFFTLYKKVPLTDDEFKTIVDKYDTEKTGTLDKAGLESVLKDVITKDGGAADNMTQMVDGLYTMLKTEDGEKVSVAELKMSLM